MPQVTILRSDPGVIQDPQGAEQKGLHVTYYTPQIPPRSVFVPGEAPTDADVQAAIAADLKAEASRPPPKTFHVTP